MRIDAQAAQVMATLHAAGHKAYAVGGCVRDALLGREPSDWDVCTDATPPRVIALFGEARCIPTGIKHGTVTVRADGALIEVTTFRTEGAYSDGRHPDAVSFVGDVREDLARRDFTVNAMAYCEEEGLIDPFGGRLDLERGVLRAVGEPKARFSEDALRILRLFRFGAKLGFALEEGTRSAALALRANLAHVSAERIFGELSKLLVAERPGAYLPVELARTILPEAAAGEEGAYAARLRAVDAAGADLAVRLAALLCDSGEAGARAALMRLRCPKALTGAVALLVCDRGLVQEEGARALRIQARRCLGRMTLADLARLTALRSAQIEAGSPQRGLTGLLAQAEALERSGDCCRVAQLAVDGAALRDALGVSGPAIGELLAWLLEQVTGEETANDAPSLLRAAEARLRAPDCR